MIRFVCRRFTFTGIRTDALVRLYRWKTAAAIGVDSNEMHGSKSIPVAAPSGGVEAKTILEYPCVVVDTPEKMIEAASVLSTCKSVAMDIEALCTNNLGKQLGTISLVQACSSEVPAVFLFDVLTLTPPTFVNGLKPLIHNEAITKLFFDCRRDVEALSTQMQLKPSSVLDLQLYYTALQWKQRSVNRRSGLTFVLKQITGLTPVHDDCVVQAAMTMGNRPVWDVRPLPKPYLEYAANDVRHILLMEPYLSSKDSQVPIDALQRLSAQYVEHYAVGHSVQKEADAKSAEVNISWLQRYIGPGGVCRYCGAVGHIEAECFKKQHGRARCSFCGGVGHTSRNCYQKYPQLLKCEACGQLGHTAASCFKQNPCKRCGGYHSTVNCNQQLQKVKYFGGKAVESAAPLPESGQYYHPMATSTTRPGATYK